MNNSGDNIKNSKSTPCPVNCKAPHLCQSAAQSEEYKKSHSFIEKSKTPHYNPKGAIMSFTPNGLKQISYDDLNGKIKETTNFAGDLEW